MNPLTVFHKLKERVVALYHQLNLKRFDKATGRPRALANELVIALAVYKHTQGIPTRKQIWNDFGLPCAYKTFNESVNRLFLSILRVICALMVENRAEASLVKHTDSTDIPVCLNKNAKHHKTMRELARWGYGSKGYYFGLKLHITSDYDGRLLSVAFSPANLDDRKMFMTLNDMLEGVFVADAGYISKKLANEFNTNRRVLIAKPKANMKKLATDWQNNLYDTRSKVEALFNNTKKFRRLVSSLSRSVRGYLCNYLCSLLAEMLA